MKVICVLTVIIFNGIYCVAQDPVESEHDFSQFADELIGFQDQDADYEEMYENLMQILSNPINLNTAQADDLKLVQILSDQQINAFINYRNEQGNLLSLYELQIIPGFDLQTIHRLLPLVRVTAPENMLNRSLLDRMFNQENNYFISRYERTLETKNGFKRSSDLHKEFKGSDDKLYLRFRSANPKDFSIGFTVEKDAGEQFRWNPSSDQYGVDFLSYHAQIQNKGRIKNLIIGDFQCQFAQGLILGGAFGLGKGAETITTTRRSNIGLLPYTSVNEAGFYRGIGTTYQLAKHLNLTGFFSFIKRDATTQPNDSIDTTISAFQLTGLHRNEEELANRKMITEKNYGLVLNYTYNKLDAGFIINTINFSNPVFKNPSAYNQFTFNGEANTNAGLFINYTHNNFNFFSEAAKSLNGGVGLVTGLLGSLHRNLDMAMVFRKYDKHFHTFYANAFSENSQPQNETGLYWGWKYNWSRKYSIAGYTDLFKFPWLGFRRYAPSIGHEWLIRLSYQPSRKILLYAQVREESKARNSAINENLYIVTNGIKRNYWLTINYNLSTALSFKTRALFNTYSLDEIQTKGLTLIQDVSYSFGRFQVSARHALFDSKDYENRTYVYENDAWMAFSMPAYYGVGIRNYVLLEYKLNKRISVWLRYARTFYTDRDSIGSGIDTINSNIRRDIKLQSIFRF